MAVAGSGGWIPSAQYVFRGGELRQISLPQNTPRDLVIGPEQAAGRLRAGQVARLDVRGGVALAAVRGLISIQERIDPCV